MGAVISILLYEDLVNEMFNLFMAKVMALDPRTYILTLFLHVSKFIYFLGNG